jgi:hypothetical protein
MHQHFIEMAGRLIFQVVEEFYAKISKKSPTVSVRRFKSGINWPKLVQ